jgi:hypothetical protein
MWKNNSAAAVLAGDGRRQFRLAISSQKTEKLKQPEPDFPERFGPVAQGGI